MNSTENTLWTITTTRTGEVSLTTPRGRVIPTRLDEAEIIESLRRQGQSFYLVRGA